MLTMAMAILPHGHIGAGILEFWALVTILTAGVCVGTDFMTLAFLRREPGGRRYRLLLVSYVLAAAMVVFGRNWFGAFRVYADVSILLLLTHLFATASVAFSLLAPLIDVMRRTERNKRRARISVWVLGGVSVVLLGILGLPFLRVYQARSAIQEVIGDPIPPMHPVSGMSVSAHNVNIAGASAIGILAIEEQLRFLYDQGRLRSLTASRIDSEAMPGVLDVLYQLDELEDLDLSYSSVTDAHVGRVIQLTNLRMLNLGNCPITDQSLTLVAKSTKLRSLWICGTYVTDAGLTHLRSLKNLETLDVSRTAITEDGMRRFKKNSASPGVRVIKHVDPHAGK